MDQSLLEAAVRCMLQNSRDMIFVKDSNLVYRAASDSFAKMVGKESAAEIIGRTDREVFSDEQLAKRYEMDDRKLLEGGKDLPRFIEPITDEDGQPRYGATSKHILRDDAGNIIGLLGVTEDITREYRARQCYQQELSYLFKLPEDAYAVCYIDVDDWRIIKQRRQQIENGTLQECQTVEELCEFARNSVVTADEDMREFYRDFSQDTIRGIYESGRRRLSFDYSRRMSDGSVRWVRNKVHFLTDADNGHLCMMLSARDINESKLEEQKIKDAAELDLMTKVFNRETAMDYIEQILQEEYDRGHSLYMLDVDNFKRLNDTLGHQAGDEFLICLANRLKNTVRESDIIGRIGGDEFFVFLRNVSEPDMVKTKAQQLLGVITEVAKEYLQVDMSGSIGVGRYPENGIKLDTLYAKADGALYEAKNAGKNCYRMAK